MRQPMREMGARRMEAIRAFKDMKNLRPFGKFVCFLAGCVGLYYFIEYLRHT